MKKQIILFCFNCSYDFVRLCTSSDEQRWSKVTTFIEFNIFVSFWQICTNSYDHIIVLIRIQCNSSLRWKNKLQLRNRLGSFSFELYFVACIHASSTSSRFKLIQQFNHSFSFFEKNWMTELTELVWWTSSFWWTWMSELHLLNELEVPSLLLRLAFPF